jgi:hypothetical protein
MYSNTYDSENDADDENNILHYLADYKPSIRHQEREPETKIKPMGVFAQCPICFEHLNNYDGPEPDLQCRSNCTDVIKVCKNKHLFHRGCIINSYATRYNNYTCPLCREKLFADLINTKTVPISELIIEDKKGGRKRRKKTRKTITRKKRSVKHRKITRAHK